DSRTMSLDRKRGQEETQSTARAAKAGPAPTVVGSLSRSIVTVRQGRRAALVGLICGLLVVAFAWAILAPPRVREHAESVPRGLPPELQALVLRIEKRGGVVTKSSGDGPTEIVGLDLSNALFTDADIPSLAPLKHLRSLDLGRSLVTDSSMALIGSFTE